MSRASRSDTPDRGLRAPRSPLSVSSTSTPPQAPPAGEATPPAPASGDAEHCCVCLERLLPAAHGAQLRVPFPACSRHSMHLECLAQYRAQANGPPDLLCPLCRHSRCPECAHEGGPVCMTNTCGRYVAGKACPCRSGCRAKSPCGKLSKTTNSARSPPTMRPNPERHQESPSFAATGSRPWAARAGPNSFDCRTARCSGRPSLSGLTLA